MSDPLYPFRLAALAPLWVVCSAGWAVVAGAQLLVRRAAR